MMSNGSPSTGYKPDLLPSEALHSLLHPKANIPVTLLSSSSSRHEALSLTEDRKRYQGKATKSSSKYNPITNAALSSLTSSPIPVPNSPRFQQQTYHEHALFGTKGSTSTTKTVNVSSSLSSPRNAGSSSLWKAEESQSYLQSLTQLANGTTTSWDHAIQAQQRKINSAGVWDGSSSSRTTNNRLSSRPQQYDSSSPRASIHDHFASSSTVPFASSSLSHVSSSSSSTTTLPTWLSTNEFNNLIQENRQRYHQQSQHQIHNSLSSSSSSPRTTANVPPKSPRSIPTPSDRSVNKGRIRNTASNTIDRSLADNHSSSLQQYATPDAYVQQLSSAILPLPPLTAGAGISVLRQLSPAVAGTIYFGAFRLLDRDHDGLLKPGDVLSLIVALKLPYILEAKYLDDHSKLAATMGSLGIDYVSYVRLCHKDTGGRLTGMAAWLHKNGEEMKKLPGYAIAPLELDNHGHLTGLFRSTMATDAMQDVETLNHTNNDAGVQTSRPTTTSTSTTVVTNEMRNGSLYRKRNKPNNEYSSNNTNVSTPGAPATPSYYRPKPVSADDGDGIFGWSSVSRPVTSNNHQDSDCETETRMNSARSPRPGTGNSTNSTVYVLKVLPVPMGNKNSKYRSSDDGTEGDKNNEDATGDDGEDEAYRTFAEEHGRIVEDEQRTYPRQHYHQGYTVTHTMDGRKYPLSKLTNQDRHMISTLSTGLLNGPSVFRHGNHPPNDIWDDHAHYSGNHGGSSSSGINDGGGIRGGYSASFPVPSSSLSPNRPIGSRGGLRTAQGSRARTPGLRVDFDIAKNSTKSPDNDKGIDFTQHGSATKEKVNDDTPKRNEVPNPLYNRPDDEQSKPVTKPSSDIPLETVTNATMDDIEVFLPSVSSTPVNLPTNSHTSNEGISLANPSPTPLTVSSSAILFTALPEGRSTALESNERPTKMESVQLSLVLQRYEGAKRLTRIMRRITRRRKRAAFQRWTDYVIYRIRQNFEKAVIIIQKMIRGYLARKAVREHMAIVRLMRDQQLIVNRDQYERDEAMYEEAVTKAEAHAASTIQSFWRTLVTEKQIIKNSNEAKESEGREIVLPPPIPLSVSPVNKNEHGKMDPANTSTTNLRRSVSPTTVNRKARSSSPVRSLLSTNPIRTYQDQVQEAQFLSSGTPTLDQSTFVPPRNQRYPPPDDMDERLVTNGVSVFLPPVQYGKIEIHRKPVRSRGEAPGNGVFLGKLTQPLSPNDEQPVGERVERNLRRRDSFGQISGPRVCDICNDLTAARQCYDCTHPHSRATSPTVGNRSVSPGGTSRNLRYCTACFIMTHGARKAYRRHQYSDVRQPPGIQADTEGMQALQLFRELDAPVGAEVPHYSRKGDIPDRSKTAIVCTACHETTASRACFDCVPAGKPPMYFCRACFVASHGQSKVKIVHQYRTVNQPVGVVGDKAVGKNRESGNGKGSGEVRSVSLASRNTGRSMDSQDGSVTSSLSPSRATSPVRMGSPSNTIFRAVSPSGNDPGGNTVELSSPMKGALPGDDFYAGPVNRTVQVSNNNTPVAKPDVPLFDSDRLANNTLQHVSDVPRGRKAIEKMKAEGLSLVAGLFDDPNKGWKTETNGPNRSLRTASRRSRTPVPLSPSSLRRIEAPIDVCAEKEIHRTVNVVQVENDGTVVKREHEKKETENWGFDDDGIVTMNNAMMEGTMVGERIERNVRRRGSSGKVSEPRVCDICNDLTAARQCYDCTHPHSRATSPTVGNRSVSPGGTSRNLRYCTACFIMTHGARKAYRRHQYSDVRQPPGIQSDMNANVARQELQNPVGAEVPRYSRKGDIPHPITKPIICTVCHGTTASRGCYDCVPTGKSPLAYCRSCFVIKHGQSKVRMVHQYRIIDQPVGMEADKVIEIIDVKTGESTAPEEKEGTTGGGRALSRDNISPGRLLSRSQNQIIRESIRIPSPLSSPSKGVGSIKDFGSTGVSYPIKEVDNENETPRTARTARGSGDILGRTKRSPSPPLKVEVVEADDDGEWKAGNETMAEAGHRFDTKDGDGMKNSEGQDDGERLMNNPMIPNSLAVTNNTIRRDNVESSERDQSRSLLLLNSSPSIDDTAADENPLPTVYDAPLIGRTVIDGLPLNDEQYRSGIKNTNNDQRMEDNPPNSEVFVPLVRKPTASEDDNKPEASTIDRKPVDKPEASTMVPFSLTVHTMDTSRKAMEEIQIQAMTEHLRANESHGQYPLLQLPLDVFSLPPTDSENKEDETVETDSKKSDDIAVASSPPSRQGKRNKYRGKGAGIGGIGAVTEDINPTNTIETANNPGQWHALWDAHSNAYYYWNDGTNVTQWEQPYGVPIEGLPPVEDIGQYSVVNGSHLNEGYYEGITSEEQRVGLRQFQETPHQHEHAVQDNHGNDTNGRMGIADREELHYIKGSSGYDANVQSSSVFLLQ